MWMLFYYFHFNYKNIWFLSPCTDFLSPAFASSIFFSIKSSFYLRLSPTVSFILWLFLPPAHSIVWMELGKRFVFMCFCQMYTSSISYTTRMSTVHCKYLPNLNKYRSFFFFHRLGKVWRTKEFNPFFSLLLYILRNVLISSMTARSIYGLFSFVVFHPRLFIDFSRLILVSALF